MSSAQFSISLEWKSFPVDLNAIEAWMKSNVPNYCGNSADSHLTLWFTEQPSHDDLASIQAKWDGIDSSDAPEAASYQSLEQVQAATEAKKASGNAKLLALGLTQDEIDALVGA